jgi:hypothetical protein
VAFFVFILFCYQRTADLHFDSQHTVAAAEGHEVTPFLKVRNIVTRFLAKVHQSNEKIFDGQKRWCA